MTGVRPVRPEREATTAVPRFLLVEATIAVRRIRRESFRSRDDRGRSEIAARASSAHGRRPPGAVAPRRREHAEAVLEGRTPPVPAAPPAPPPGTRLIDVTEIETRIEKLVAGGDGLARFQGVPIFIPRAAPGDLVRARIVERSRTTAGRRSSRSSSRVRPAGPIPCRSSRAPASPTSSTWRTTCRRASRCRRCARRWSISAHVVLPPRTSR